MAIDGSETGNIERQSLGDPLSAQRNPLKQHGLNVVDRSFKQTATPVGTPENIMNTLLEAAGHVGTAAGTYMQKAVDEDKTVQSMNFYNGLAPSDEATTAGYRAHAVLNMSNKVLTSTAALKKDAETFIGTDGEFNQKVKESQSADHAALIAEYPQLDNDPLAGKAIVAMYGEQVPAIAAVRQSAKLAQEHEGRLNTFRDHIRVRVDGLSEPEADAVLNGVMDHSNTLQLTKKDTEKELSVLALEKAEVGDLSLINYTKRYTGGQATSLFDRSNALQKGEIAGKKVYELQHQEVIAKEKMELQGKLEGGLLTKEEFLLAAGNMNRRHSNLAYTDDSMLSNIKRTDKETPYLNQTAQANSIAATTDALNRGEFKGNRAGFFTRAGGDNVRHGAMVWTDNAMNAAWMKHEADTAVNTDVIKYTSEFFTQTRAGSVPLGQRGLDTKTNDDIIASAKLVIDREGKREIAALPAGHTPQDEQAIKDKYTASYMQYLSASRLKDPEFVRLLSSFKLTDMADAPNMKHLNSNTERAILLYTSMDEGAKAEHIPDKADRALFENFLSYTDQGISRVSAMEKAIYANRHPRVLTSAELKDAESQARTAANASTSSWKGYIPGGFTDANAPAWYQAIHEFEIRRDTIANMLGGVIEPKAAAQLARTGFENTHTKLPNGMFVKGTLPVLSTLMKVHPNDVPTVFMTYLEMNKNDLEDIGHVPIADMYIATSPQRGTFQVKTKLGDTLGLPSALTELKKGAGAFLDNKRFDWKKALEGMDVGSATGGLGGSPQTLTHPENSIEDNAKLERTIAYVEGSGGFDRAAGSFKPYRDGNGNQWNIGYGLAISDKEYKRDYIIRDGTRYNLGNQRPSNITLNVAKQLMDSEINRGQNEIRSYWKGYDDLPVKYQHVLSSLHYNIGSVKPSNWPKLMEAMNNRDDAGVRREMITSFKNAKGERFVLNGRAKDVADRSGLK